MKWKEKTIQKDVIIPEAIVEIGIEEEEDQIAVADLDQEGIEKIIIEEKEDQALLRDHRLHHQVCHLKDDRRQEEL